MSGVEDINAMPSTSKEIKETSPLDKSQSFLDPFQ